MAWLQSLDVSLFRFVYLTLSNPVFDVLMPFLSGNRLFYPALVVLGVWLLWKGGTRGRVCVCLLAVIVLLGDHLVVNTLKYLIGRPRPLESLADLAKGLVVTSGKSMPSAHTSKWFAATLVAYALYPRSWRFLLPLALAVGFSRIYVGAHYPSDVLVGAVVGTGYAAAGLLGLNALWRWIGRRWFPLWWRRLPLLIDPDRRSESHDVDVLTPSSALLDQHWLRLGYGMIAVVLLARWAFLASGLIELSKDEAYQWLWSKHLALSYYSKPPLIAYTQFLGTGLWGDTAFGVRFFSPLIGAVLGFLMLRFMARVTSAQTGFWLVLVLLTTPLLAVGSTLMTIDPLLVLFWTLAMVLGWRALQPDSTTIHWLGVGLALGLAFLSKYSALYQVVCWAIFFWLWPAARVHLRRAGPWLALLVLLLSTLPVLIWNAQHGWITVEHVADNAKLRDVWHPTLRFFWYFVLAESALMNPFYLVAALWAMAALWRRTEPAESPGGAPTQSQRRSIMIYLFCMGAPVFLGHWLYSFHSRILPNWIAPAIVPMFCLMAVYWESRWRQGVRWITHWFRAGLIFGLVVLVVLHEPLIIAKLVGRPLPPDKDPLRRVRGWNETARLVDDTRNRLLAEGKPVFILAHHYGITGLLSFYWPEAKAALGQIPLVYPALGKEPKNQFYFWPEYRYRNWRNGQNAIFVVELSAPQYSLSAWGRSLFDKGATELQPAPPEPKEVPAELRQQFESVKDLGVHPVLYHRRVYRWIQLFECRNLR